MTRDRHRNLGGEASPPDNSSPLSASRKIARRIVATERELKSFRSGTDARAKQQAVLDELRAEAEENREIDRAFCNECGGLRDHDIIYDRKRKVLREDPIPYFPVKAQDFILPFVKDLDEEERRRFTIQFMVLKCRGCRSEIARQTEYLSVIETFEDILTNPEVDDSFGEGFFQSCFEVAEYPPSIARRRPAWMTLLSASRALIPEPVGDLMEEIYKALQSGSPRLVAMGVRAVLEEIMVGKTGDHGSFSKNLDGFQAEGYVSLRQRNVIEAILEAGHASIHRGWRPGEREITTLIDLAESIIETTYLHEHQAKELETVIPKRPPKNLCRAI